MIIYQYCIYSGHYINSVSIIIAEPRLLIVTVCIQCVHLLVISADSFVKKNTGMFDLIIKVNNKQKIIAFTKNKIN